MWGRVAGFMPMPMQMQVPMGLQAPSAGAFEGSPRARAMLARPLARSKSPRMMAAAAASSREVSEEVGVPVGATTLHSRPADSKEVLKAIARATELQLAVKKLRKSKA